MYIATSAFRRSSSASERAELAVGEADADARARVDLLAVDLELTLERAEDPPRDVRRLLGVLDPVEQDGELVAAEARDGVGRAHRCLEPARDLLQDGVAGRVAEAVVDRLEVVEVDEHDADRRAASDRAHERVLDAVGEQRAVGEVRDGVVERLVRELVLERLPLADVAAVQDDAADVLVLEQVGVLHLELEPRAVAMPERALDHVRLGAAAGVRLADAGDDLREPRTVGRRRAAGRTRVPSISSTR